MTGLTDGVYWLTDGAVFDEAASAGYGTIMEYSRAWTNEALARVAAGARWLDVRYPPEYLHDGLPGALNIPLNELRESLPALDRAREYVIYCQSGRRSAAAAFLMAQMVFGLLWSGDFAGAEWALAPSHITWGWPLVAALAFIAIGPAVVAYRCWGIGVQRAGPAIAGFFSNLTPLFAALMSAAFLGEAPRAYHALAFALIVGGIVVSSRR